MIWNIFKDNSERGSDFITNVIKLASGTAFIQLLSILASPIITRLYGPEAYGISALFASITGILVVITCLRYEPAIMISKDKEEAANLLGISLLLVIITCILTAPFFLLKNQYISYFLNSPDLSIYLWMVPILLFLRGLFLAMSYWSSRTKRFGSISIARMTNSFATTVTQLAFGSLGYISAGSLISASLFGSMLSTFMIGLQIWRADHKFLKANLKSNNMRYVLWRYKKFPIVDSWSALINALSWQMPVLLLSFFFSSKIVGFYALGFNTIQLPISILGSAIVPVFFQRAVEAKREGTLDNFLEHFFRISIAFSMFPFLILAIIGEDLFIVVFGNDWSEAGIYAQMMSIWAIPWLISTPLSTMFSIFEKQELNFKFNIINLAIRFSAIYIGGLLNNSRLALFLFALSGLLIYGYICIWVMSESSIDISKIFLIFFKNFSLFIPVGLILIILNTLQQPLIELIIASVFLIIYLYYIINICSDTNFLFKKIFNNFKIR